MKDLHAQPVGFIDDFGVKVRLALHPFGNRQGTARIINSHIIQTAARIRRLLENQRIDADRRHIMKHLPPVIRSERTQFPLEPLPLPVIPVIELQKSPADQAGIRSGCVHCPLPSPARIS